MKETARMRPNNYLNYLLMLCCVVMTILYMKSPSIAPNQDGVPCEQTARGGGIQGLKDG